MKLVMLGCKVFSRELYALCAKSPNIVEIRWMKAALHKNPQADLRPALQRAIDEVEAGDVKFDAILLGFGLCSMGIVGLHSKKYPLVVPRAHDCVTMLLGSREKYQELFDEHNGGVYWYSAGWLEQMDTPGRGYDEQAKYMDYVEKYGEDNAQYLIEVEKSWVQTYECAALIRYPGLPNDRYAEMTREAAKKMELDYIEAPGDDSILRRLVDGEWDEDFLVTRPGQKIVFTGDEDLIDAE